MSLFKVATWLSGVSCLGLNIFVVGYQQFSLRKQRAPKNLLLLGLALSDTVTGTYVLTLAVADRIMEGSYVRHAQNWEHGYGCIVLAFGQTFAAESSLSSLVLVSLISTRAIVDNKKPG